MDEKSNLNEPIEQKVQQPQKSEWYDPVVKIVQQILNFNMIAYKKEKVPRL